MIVIIIALSIYMHPHSQISTHTNTHLIIKERKGFPAEIFDWSRAEVSA